MLVEEYYKHEATSVVISAVADALSLVWDKADKELDQKSVPEILYENKDKVTDLIWELQFLLPKNEALELVSTLHTSNPDYKRVVLEVLGIYKEEKQLQFKSRLDMAARQKVFPAISAPRRQEDNDCLKYQEFGNLTVVVTPSPKNWMGKERVECLNVVVKKKEKQVVKPDNFCLYEPGLPEIQRQCESGNCSLNSKIFLYQSLAKQGYQGAAWSLARRAFGGQGGHLRKLLQSIILGSGVWSAQAKVHRYKTIGNIYPLILQDDWDTCACWEQVFFNSQSVLLRTKICSNCNYREAIYGKAPHLTPEEAAAIVGVDEFESCGPCPSCLEHNLKLQLCIPSNVVAIDFCHPGTIDGMPTIDEATAKGLLPPEMTIGGYQFKLIGLSIREVFDWNIRVRDGRPDKRTYSMSEIAKRYDASRYVYSETHDEGNNCGDEEKKVQDKNHEIEEEEDENHEPEQPKNDEDEDDEDEDKNYEPEQPEIDEDEDDEDEDKNPEPDQPENDEDEDEEDEDEDDEDEDDGFGHNFYLEFQDDGTFWRVCDGDPVHVWSKNHNDNPYSLREGFRHEVQYAYYGKKNEVKLKRAAQTETEATEPKKEKKSKNHKNIKTGSKTAAVKSRRTSNARMLCQPKNEGACSEKMHVLDGKDKFQLREFSDNNVQSGDYLIRKVPLKFSLFETTTEQDDCFPPGISVKVKNKLLTLPVPNPIPTSNKPGVEPKRPPRPNNISPLLKLSPTVGNTVNVSWAQDYTRNFVVKIYLKKLSSTDLLSRLKNKGVRPAEEKLQEDADYEIATTSLRVSLMCPLGKMRMSVPCRPSTCVHLQCFDASLFIQMNETTPTWNCPVCDKHALYDTLVIDGYFQDVLKSSRLPADCNEIQLTSDGSWTIISTKKESNAQNLSPKKEAVAAPAAKVENVETLSDEAVLEDQPPKKKPAPVMVDLTLSDSEDESPPKKMHNRIQVPDLMRAHLPLLDQLRLYENQDIVEQPCQGVNQEVMAQPLLRHTLWGKMRPSALPQQEELLVDMFGVKTGPGEVCSRKVISNPAADSPIYGCLEAVEFLRESQYTDEPPCRGFNREVMTQPLLRHTLWGKMRPSALPQQEELLVDSNSVKFGEGTDPGDECSQKAADSLFAVSWNAAARLHESNFTFHLTPEQATKIAMSFNSIGEGEYSIQVQLRFSLFETTTEQDDCFPPGISVKVKNKLLTLPVPNPIPSNKPGVEPPLLKSSPTVGNTVNVSWAQDYTRNFVVKIYLKKLSSTDLLSRLKNKGVRPAEEKLQEDADYEIATTSLRVSLMCPLGKMRMSVPCRPSTCVHLQCFDASLFIQMNETTPTWNCPVCDKHALYDTLVIDGYFQVVLLSSRLPADCNGIQLASEGSWTIISTKKESNARSLSRKRKAAAAPAAKVENVETLSDEAEVLEDQPPNKKPAPVMVDLTLSDSEDESPPKKMHNRIQAPESSSSNRSFDSNARPTSPSSVGRQSPSVITLESPSPSPSIPFLQPSSTTGHLDPPPAHSNNFRQMYYNSMSTAPSLPILDLDFSVSHTWRNQNFI
ncbi:uncharacterized protein LOC132195861 isoform X2 [Neocloeon triangulifer]|uniref:uncharacterized protein LOC132195861 isoform X2 n=1 Tax=Neocloeon triangulifer TaxID=2078957 RepID=UPI00286F9F44|nr:uncharacterized protein LOC132195861 isoform X2 [Neocloeon triangulifer]